jgi:hypothetical protein
MSRKFETLTQDYLKEILDYDPKTGIFKWKVSKRKTREGDIAGSVNTYNRRVISIDGLSFTASRLAFLYMTGVFPVHSLRHLNKKNADDSWDNLKEVVPLFKRKVPNIADKPPGKYPGIHWRVRKAHWEVKFYTNGRHIILGCFDTFDEAVECKKEADNNRNSDYNYTDESVVTDVDVELDVKYDKWKATAWVNGRKLYLGLFPTRDSAIKAQTEAEQEDELDERGLMKMNRNNTWKCHAMVGGVNKHVGYFDNKLDAIRARDAMEGTDGY